VSETRYAFALAGDLESVFISWLTDALARLLDE
jgi:hypothetical protein